MVKLIVIISFTGCLIGCNAGMSVRGTGDVPILLAAAALGKVTMQAHTALVGEAMGMADGKEVRHSETYLREVNGRLQGTVFVGHEYQN